MSQITRSYSFTDGTTAYGSQVESEVQNIVTVWNNHDGGTSSWGALKTSGNLAVTGTSTLTGLITATAGFSGHVYGTTLAAEMGINNTQNSISIGSVGTYPSITVQDNKTMTFVCPSNKTFLILASNGDGVMVNTNYTTATITLTGTGGSIVASSTPSSGQIGIFKSAANHTISIKTGTAYSGVSSTISILFFGSVSAITNWA